MRKIKITLFLILVSPLIIPFIAFNGLLKFINKDLYNKFNSMLEEIPQHEIY